MQLVNEANELIRKATGGVAAECCKRICPHHTGCTPETPDGPGSVRPHSLRDVGSRGGIHGSRPSEDPGVTRLAVPAGNGASLVFPYRGTTGGPIRIRAHQEARTFTEGQRGSWSSTRPRRVSRLTPSFPSSFQKNFEFRTPLIFTEGEKKALCACQHGFATIGLSGVWSWKRKGEKGLLPELTVISWENRQSPDLLRFRPHRERECTPCGSCPRDCVGPSRCRRSHRRVTARPKRREDGHRRLLLPRRDRSTIQGTARQGTAPSSRSQGEGRGRGLGHSSKDRCRDHPGLL